MYLISQYVACDMYGQILRICLVFLVQNNKKVYKLKKCNMIANSVLSSRFPDCHVLVRVPNIVVYLSLSHNITCLDFFDIFCIATAYFFLSIHTCFKENLLRANKPCLPCPVNIAMPTISLLVVNFSDK